MSPKHKKFTAIFRFFRCHTNLGGIPKGSTRFSLDMEMIRLTRDGTAGTVSRDQILSHERVQRNRFSCSADHEQDGQPYPVDSYSCDMCDHKYIHT